MRYRISVEHLAGSRKGARESFTTRLIRAGRDPACEIRFHSEMDIDASATHAEIRSSGSGFKLLDLGSTNGTYLNGEKVIESVLSTGDRIEFGRGGPIIRVSISRVYRPGAGLLAVVGALILVGGLVFALRVLRPEEESLPVVIDEVVPGSDAVIAVYSRAWFTTKSSVEIVAEAWGTGILVSPDGLALVPKHVVQPWKFDPEAAAMFQHYGERMRTIVAAWPGGVPLLREGEPDLPSGLTTENGRLEIYEAPDVPEAPTEVRFTAGGKDVVEEVTLHKMGSHDIVLLRMEGEGYPFLDLTGCEGPPEGAVDLRILGQRIAAPPPDRLESTYSSRRILRTLEDSFELEVGPLYRSGAVLFWKDRPVGIYSEIFGRCLPLGSVKEALMANPTVRERFGALLGPPPEGE